jgi:hypothetical protein
MPVAPSNLIVLTSDSLANAQARLRELAIASTDPDTINRLIRLRKSIDAQQRRIMNVNLQIIDADPAVLNNINQLTSLAGEIAAAVQEMRSITRAIRLATTVLAVAEQFLSLAAIA